MIVVACIPGSCCPLFVWGFFCDSFLLKFRIGLRLSRLHCLMVVLSSEKTKQKNITHSIVNMTVRMCAGCIPSILHYSLHWPGVSVGICDKTLGRSLDVFLQNLSN